MKSNPTAMEFLDTLGANSTEAVHYIQDMEAVEKQAIARLSAHVLARKVSLQSLKQSPVSVDVI